MGIIRSLLSVFKRDKNKPKKFNPTDDMLIMQMSISYSGMARYNTYHFSLKSEGSKVVFNCDYMTSNDDGIQTHTYENVSVDPSYMDKLRKLAKEKNLVERMKKYRKPRVKYKLLDGDMKYTSLGMSDGTQKSADILFDSEYHDFFLSIAKAYPEFDGVPCPEDASDE